jgi:hypothetical protein
MNKPFCDQIDRESLVEEYVRGKLPGALRAQFEQHLHECARHAREVQLEKSLRNGVIEFARSQVRSTIHKDLRPKEDMRYAILRYAAFLFVAVVIPLLLYYQFRIFQPALNPAEVIPAQPASADSVQKRSVAAAAKSAESLVESAAARKFAARAKKDESVPPVAPPVEEFAPEAEKGVAATELPALEMEKQQDLAAGQIAAGSRERDQQSAAEVPQSVPGIAESKTKSLQDIGTKGYTTKERYEAKSGDLKETDSSQNEIMIRGYGVSAAGGKSYIDDQNIYNQISSQQTDLSACIPVRDSTAFITVTFMITKPGSVEKLQVTATNIRNANIEACIIEKIRHWQFKAMEQNKLVTRKIFLK